MNLEKGKSYVTRAGKKASILLQMGDRFLAAVEDQSQALYYDALGKSKTAPELDIIEEVREEVQEKPRKANPAPVLQAQLEPTPPPVYVPRPDDGSYDEFLNGKRRTYVASGIQVPAESINPLLFAVQRDIVLWALRKGKSCIFANTGLGKTLMQLEWAQQIVNHTQGKVLILAPLAVASQTVAEGEKFGITVTHCRAPEHVRPGINITNYELLDKFDCKQFDGIVLDESSILKSYTSKTRNQIIELFKDTPFRLACTATPAPNDHMELGNHAEFVGVMSRTEMLSLFFVHDGGETSKWRLKGHAEAEFWKWVASWAVMLSKPSDLGYESTGYDLLPLNLEQITVEDQEASAQLAEIKANRRNGKVSLEAARALRKTSLVMRVEATAKLVNSKPGVQWVVWCDLNDESEALTAAIPGAVEVAGTHSSSYKERAFDDFTAGQIRVLVTKPSIAGFGMNWQNCHHTAFVGLSYSFEAYYQAVRRFWRFGQTNMVNAFIVTSSAEQGVVDVIKEKERKFDEMLAGMISATQEITKANIQATVRTEAEYAEEGVEGKNWKMLLGDSCKRMREIADNSVGFSVFSPPFASLYTYSNSERDLGNCASETEFFGHFNFIVKELLRVTMPGRLVSVHCMLLPTSKQRHGVIGIRDFRGDLIRLFQDAGFIFHSEVAIWKNPVIAMQRTKALGLLHKQVKKDSAMSRQGINDYLITFRKPGENTQPITHTNETFPVSMWQQFASPVWADVNPSDTLQFRSARDNNDERHICPLQLSVIQRAVFLWSNPGDLVFSPFAGIGSEGWQSIVMGRRFLGIELKPSYFKAAVNNLATKEANLTPSLECPVFNVFAGREKYGVKVEVPEEDEQEAA